MAKSNDLLFALFSIGILLLILITAYYEHEPEWEEYQRGYFASMASIAEKELGQKELESIPREIQQDWIPELGVVDRCRTCHIAIENPAFANDEQPLRSHPEMPNHPFQKFACTVCHQGQGRATIERDAHGYAENWEYPLLPGRMVEGSCGKCHRDKNFPSAPALMAGRSLMDRAGCIGCHLIDGWDKPEMLGPDLIGLGGKVSADWLFRWLRRPKDYLTESFMPNFHLTEDEALNLTAWLMSSRFEDPEPYAVKNRSQESLEDFYDLGQTRFRQSRCISCHSVNGRGGTIGPDLGRIADKVNRTWLSSWLMNPKAYLHQTRMPRYSFPDKDIEAIVEYMFTEFSSFEEEDSTISIHLNDLTPAMIEDGKKLAKHYGCYGCHRLPDDITGGDVGPELTEIGSKEISKVEFGTVKIDHSLPNWLFVKLRNPTIFLPDLKMPDYGFTPQEAELVTTALLGLSTKNIISSYVIETPEESDYEPAGHFGQLVEEYQCLSCHIINGRGSDLATDLSLEGSQVQTGWLIDYLKTPYAIRPTLTERMPRLNLSDVEASTIVEYVKLVLRDDRIPEDIGELTGAMALEGEELYYQKYACWSCHIIGRKGGGYYGPALTEVGRRLTPGWIYTRLQNPQAFVPNSREPHFDISDDELKALTAFLMTLTGAD